MDSARYWLALVVVVGYPAGVGLWLLVHGFVVRWRKLGLVLTYSVLVGLTVVSWVVMFAIRDPLLRVEYGTRTALLINGAILYLIAVAIEVLCWKQLTLKTLVGIPEIAPETSETELLRDGIYARMRHPRYVGWSFGLFAVALATNYLAVYLLALLFIPTIYLISNLEERELRMRFGDKYAEYQAAVPRFIPRPRAKESNA